MRIYATLLILLAACTSQPQQSVQVPTLAILPIDTSPTSIPTIAPTNTPECDLAAWWDSTEPIIEQFLDTAEVAAQTSRMALSTVLLEMRQLQREYEREHELDCEREIFRAVSNGMDYAADAFGEFMAQSEVISDVYFMLASQYFWDAYNALLERGVIADVRMADTAVFIWGGDSPNAATATRLAVTSTPTSIPLPTMTFVPGSRTATSPFGVRLRAGPSIEYDEVGEVGAGVQMQILGHDDFGEWLNVRLPDGQEGWVFAALVDLDN